MKWGGGERNTLSVLLPMKGGWLCKRARASSQPRHFPSCGVGGGLTRAVGIRCCLRCGFLVVAAVFCNFPSSPFFGGRGILLLLSILHFAFRGAVADAGDGILRVLWHISSLFCPLPQSGLRNCKARQRGELLRRKARLHIQSLSFVRSERSVKRTGGQKRGAQR